jgi:hypothetical protein
MGTHALTDVDRRSSDQGSGERKWIRMLAVRGDYPSLSSHRSMPEVIGKLVIGHPTESSVSNRLSGFSGSYRNCQSRMTHTAVKSRCINPKI